MTRTIGLAIPCYAGHAKYLESLLENIALSTRRPDAVCISCSSWTSDARVTTTVHGIPVTTWYSTETLNAAQNRNRAASCLRTDLISFLDGDDLLHPKRLEFVCAAFAMRPDLGAVYHDYRYEHIPRRDDPFWEEPSPRLLSAPLVKDPKAMGLMVLSDPPYQYSHHHAHVTVTARVASVLRFDESNEVRGREDSLYGALLVDYDVPCGYLNNKLTRYLFQNLL
jgi:glycosyltransferase involved in cell wall biosynthesis